LPNGHRVLCRGCESPLSIKPCGWNMFVQVEAHPVGDEGMDDAFVHETAELGTPLDMPSAAAPHIIDSESDTDGGPEETDEDDERAAAPSTCAGDEEEKPMPDVKPAGPSVPARVSPGAKATASPLPPPAWASSTPADSGGNAAGAGAGRGDEADCQVPRKYGERAASAPFVMADHALRAAEEVRLAGNDSFFAGRFEEAQELYKVAGRHLNSATALEEAADLAVPGYLARKLECTEKSKLNLAACRIKLGDYVGCIAACNEILIVAPNSVKALYRCGMAHMLMQDYNTARELLAKASSMEPSERAIQQAVRECASKQREAESSLRDMAKNMFSGKPQSPPKPKADPQPAPATSSGAVPPTGSKAPDGERSDTESDVTDLEGADEEEEEVEEEEEGEDGWGSVDEVTCSEATDDDEEEEDEDEEETDDEDQEDEGVEAESEFFTFTGSQGRKPPGVFDFGSKSSLAAQEAARAAAELRSATGDRLSGAAKSVLSDSERANLLDALARSRRELEEELTKQHMFVDRGAARYANNVPPPSEDAFANSNAPCPSKMGVPPSLRKPGVSTDTSARAHGTDVAWAAAMRRHAERSQSGTAPSSSSTPRGAGETPRGTQDGMPSKAGTEARASMGMDEAMTVAQRTAEEAKERGNERFRQQRWEAAAREYTSAVNLSKLPRFQRPDLAAVYLSNRAACYIRLQRFEEAVEDCEAALALSADFWKAGARAGKALLMMGDFERALAHLEHAETAANAKFEETPTARRMVDEVKKVRQLIEAGDSERALSCIKSIINETPNAFPLEMLHLQTLLACGRFEEALPVCEHLRCSKSPRLTANVACDLEHMHAMTLVGLAKLPEASTMLRNLLRSDPDNQKYQMDCRKVKAMNAKMTSGIEALEAHRFSEARECFSDALALDPTNDRFAALMLSYRAASFQKQRDEVVDSADSVARARKEVEEATAELEKAQRRMVKGNERLQLFLRREEMVRKQFALDEIATEEVPDPTPPHVLFKNEVCQGKWALNKAIDDACQVRLHVRWCACTCMCIDICMHLCVCVGACLSL